MAASKVEIANLALLRLGQRSIQSLTEQSNEATWANKLYDRTRRTVLRSFPWRFAAKIETLALVDVEITGYLYAYALPTDCLAPIEVISSYTGTTAQFERSGSEIWTDEANAQLRYIRDVQDPNEFDDGFIDAFAYRLAAELAMPVTGKEGLAAQMMSGFMLAKHEAQAISSRESRKPNPSLGSSIKDSRA